MLPQLASRTQDSAGNRGPWDVVGHDVVGTLLVSIPSTP